MLRSPRRFALAAALLAAATLLPCAAGSATVDGRLDAEYGPPRVTQTTQTSYNDARYFGDPDGYSDGSELDAAYGFISDGVLHLFLAGNVGFCCPTMFSHQEQIEIFIDSGPGGQNVLRADNAGVTSLTALAGLTFDADFDADYWFGCLPVWWAAYAPLPTSAGGAASTLGRIAYVAPGTLTGGTNPFGVAAAIVDSNTVGVTHGCAASSGVGVETGLELDIPLAAIGYPSGCIKVCAFVDGSPAVTVSNQVLGPVPAGTCALGAPAAVNFAAHADNQYFTICQQATPARTGTWGALKTVYR